MNENDQIPAFGGPGWRPRTTSLREEVGRLWAPCGLDSEWGALRSVLLHRPGRELEAVANDPQGALMLETPDPGLAQVQHDALAQSYRSLGVAVHYVDPPTLPPPNQLFAADLMAMTPEGAILGRPASPTRAGEERWVARALADLGVPILRSVRGTGTFEGADLVWLGPGAALLGRGFRTNDAGANQVTTTLQELGVEVHSTRLPPGTMHLMGQLRILDRDLAVAWRHRLPEDAVELLQASGYSVHFLPSEEEARKGYALNAVTLGPRRILMACGNPETQSFFQELGVECVAVEIGELGKATGGIGCLTGVLHRDSA